MPLYKQKNIFCTQPDQPWRPLSLLCTRYWITPGAKAAGAWH